MAPKFKVGDRVRIGMGQVGSVVHVRSADSVDGRLFDVPEGAPIYHVDTGRFLMVVPEWDLTIDSK